MTWSKKINLLFSFYLNFLGPSLILTLLCVYIFYHTGIKLLPALVWFKIITTAIIFFYIQSTKKKTFFYFYNLGLSRKWLWTCTLSFDFVLFCLLLIFTGN